VSHISPPEHSLLESQAVGASHPLGSAIASTDADMHSMTNRRGFGLMPIGVLGECTTVNTRSDSSLARS
jgi:hypothetical protein